MAHVKMLGRRSRHVYNLKCIIFGLSDLYKCGARLRSFHHEWHVFLQASFFLMNHLCSTTYSLCSLGRTSWVRSGNWYLHLQTNQSCNKWLWSRKQTWRRWFWKCLQSIAQLFLSSFYLSSIFFFLTLHNSEEWPEWIHFLIYLKFLLVSGSAIRWYYNCS